MTITPPPYIDPLAREPHPLVAARQAHCDAGRIGRRAAMDPAMRARILAAEAAVGGRPGR